MDKSPEAFRTISEVAEWLDVPTHVLRFWESRFAQVKPVKRAGGRRYYRPSDMRLIGGIKKLLHDDGMTIRSVQKLLREEGVKHVAGFSQPLEHESSKTAEVAFGAGRAKTVSGGPSQDDASDHALQSEDEADAAWESESGDPEHTGSDAPFPSAPSDAEVVAFGSSRTKADDEAPVDPAPEETADPVQLDLPEAEAPEPEIVPAAIAEPDEAPTGAPIVANVPDVDPEDDSAAHTRPASAIARLAGMDPDLLRRDGMKIEQVVAALRAVRDRSAK